MATWSSVFEQNTQRSRCVYKIVSIPCLRPRAAPSVRRSRVKFWFIKNYMSPQFKRFLPHMAKSYGFEYELVTYKWPTWLHKQARRHP